MDKQIKLFLEFLQNDKKLSNNTLQSYKRDIMQFRDYVNKNNINYAKAKEDDIKDYLEEIQKEGKKNINSFKKFSINKIFLSIFVKN